MMVASIPLPVFSGQQQCRRVSALPRPSEGVPGSAGRPGAAGPVPLSPRERSVQLDHYVRAGILPQHPEKAGSAGGRGLSGGGQFQHTMPEIGVKIVAL